jgi:hypothetical protein
MSGQQMQVRHAQSHLPAGQAARLMGYTCHCMMQEMKRSMVLSQLCRWTLLGANSTWHQSKTIKLVRAVMHRQQPEGMC